MDRRSRNSRCWRPRLFRIGGVSMLALATLSGCRSVPSEKFDNCRRLNDTLRIENARLRDQTIALTAQNQDMSERAVDDARRLRAQEQAITQLERSVHAYQAERDELEVAVSQLKRAVTNGSPNAASLK